MSNKKTGKKKNKVGMLIMETPSSGEPVLISVPKKITTSPKK